MICLFKSFVHFTLALVVYFVIEFYEFYVHLEFQPFVKQIYIHIYIYIYGGIVNAQYYISYRYIT